MSSSINYITAGNYPGGDTSQTLQFRATSSTTTALVNNTETIAPLFTSVESGAINFQAVNTTDLKSLVDGTVTGVLDLNVHTTGSNVTLSIWLEFSTNNGVTWVPVPNSLRQNVISTDATVVSNSMLLGIVFKNALTRCVAKRVGGTSCTISTDTLAVGTGSVSQPATLIRLYGI